MLIFDILKGRQIPLIDNGPHNDPSQHKKNTVREIIKNNLKLK